MGNGGVALESMKKLNTALPKITDMSAASRLKTGVEQHSKISGVLNVRHTMANIHDRRANFRNVVY